MKEAVEEGRRWKKEGGGRKERRYKGEDFLDFGGNSREEIFTEERK